MSTEDLSPDEARLLLDRLPWYVNGQIDPGERAWIDALIVRSERARSALKRELALVNAVEATVASSPVAPGLSELLYRVRLRRSASRLESARRSVLAPLFRFVDAVSQPKYAIAMVTLLVVQGMSLVWIWGDRPLGTAAHESETYRGSEAPEARSQSLRVVFAPNATEVDIRKVLVSSGARIVGGPTREGVYWIASTSRAIGDVRSDILNAGIASVAEVDPIGPRSE